MKKLFAFVPILGLIILFFLIFVAKGKKSEGEYFTAEIQRGDISIMVTATGTLEAVTTVQVGSQISGTISALYADFNSRVKKGEVLAQLDPTFLKAQVSQAQADLEKAKASVNLSKKEYERSLSLFQKNMISESEKDLSFTNYELAIAQEKSVQATLDRAKTNLDYATIYSPIEGVVISRNVDVGQTVAASLQAPTLFTIAKDLTQMQVKANIDEADIGKIKEGQDVTFTVDAYPESTFKGTVNQIRLSPEVVQNVVTYDVIIGISNPNLLLKPGMTANVTLMIDHKENILKVPSSALQFRPSMEGKESWSARKEMGRKISSSGSPDTNAIKLRMADMKKASRTALWILNSKGKPEPAFVQIGISDGPYTQVISDNLKEGDKVIIGSKGSETSSSSQQVNPFAPRFPGGRR